METISVSQLKTHLSAELKRIEGGLVVAYLDSSVVLRHLLQGDPAIRHVLAVVEREVDETLLVFSHDEAMNRCAAVLGFAVPLST